MYPILFQIGSYNFYSHGLMVAIGIIIGILVLQKMLIARQIKTNRLYDLIFFALVIGILGARLNYYLLYRGEFNSFWSFFTIWQGGLVSYGGILVAFIFAFFWLRREKQPILVWFDAGAIAMMVGLGLGRVGCFLAGDIVGKVTSSTLGISVAYDLPRWPIALFYVGADFAVFGFVYWLFQKKKLENGQYFALVMILAGLARFVIDFGREYDYYLGGLALSQWFALILVIFGWIIYFNQNLMVKLLSKWKIK